MKLSFQGFTPEKQWDDEGDYPLPCLTSSGWFSDYECRVWCRAEEISWWANLELHMPDSDIPDNHPLYFEMDAVGNLGEALEIQDVEGFLLREGIAPGQAFYMRVAFRYSTPDWEGDVGLTLTRTVLSKEPWTQEQVASAWEAYLGRKMLLLV